MEVLQLEVCSNCCESVFVCDDRDESTAFYELIRDEPVTMVSSVLERIFNLSYLKLVNGRCKEVLQQEWLENIPLCRSCLNILIQLNTSFEEFVRVRNLESYISRQIQRVHEMKMALMTLKWILWSTLGNSRTNNRKLFFRARGLF
ncbi:unnamed protein product [Allacma fusca]|uniref:Uncharacterized protein n=1 Tax=Allacma fusca TaxID=39272 RepID=A0A8J2K424_9HEXA|nr:unnamed protein product [Allacma fusca]